MWYVLLLLLASMIGLTNSADAATYWVAKTGSDSHTCAQARAESTPKLTLNAGNACLSAGDTLTVKAGTYELTESLTLKSGVTYQTFGSDTVIIGVRRDGAAVEAQNVSNMVFKGFIVDGFGDQPGVTSWALIGVFHVTNSRFEHVEVRNARGMGIMDGEASGGHQPGLEFRHMHVHHNGLSRGCTTGDGPCHGIYLHSSGVTIDGGSYHHNSEHGIVVSHCSGHPITVRNVKAYDNGNIPTSTVVGVGIGLYCGSNSRVYNNVVYNNKHGGIFAAGANSLYANNTLYGQGAYGFEVRGTSNTYRNNIIYNSGTAFTESGGTFANNLTAQ